MLDNSNSYAEVFSKLGMSTSGDSYKVLKKAIDKLGLSKEKINENRAKHKEKQLQKLGEKRTIPLEEILSGEHGSYKGPVLLKRLIENGYKEYKCEQCGLTEWQGQPIPLTLHHKDGNHSNNRLENLQVLCPNCHALTDNFAGKNINKGKRINSQKIICPICGKNEMCVGSEMCRECYDKKIAEETQIPIAREELKRKIRATPFTGIGEEFDVSDNTIKKWCIKLNLPSKRADIKSINDSDWEKI